MPVLEIAALVLAACAVPLSSIPALQAFFEIAEKTRPQYELDGWIVKVQRVIDLINTKNALIPDEVQAQFWQNVAEYLQKRAIVEEQIRQGKVTRFWKNRSRAKHDALAYLAWKNGLSLSAEADIVAQRCRRLHTSSSIYKEGPLEGKCVACYPGNPEGLLCWEMLLAAAMEDVSNRAKLVRFDPKHDDKDGSTDTEGTSESEAPHHNEALALSNGAAVGFLNAGPVLDNVASVPFTIALDDLEERCITLANIKQEDHREISMLSLDSSSDICAWRSEALRLDADREY